MSIYLSNEEIANKLRQLGQEMKRLSELNKVAKSKEKKLRLYKQAYLVSKNTEWYARIQKDQKTTEKWERFKGLDEEERTLANLG